uniref:Uncharacterized protein n=1 Tax=Ralstonia syzygii R24 TaxID=907261 RepID=G3A7U2_9RALS|nr:hypothetical protein RALSY_40805 [Ralstonia syzygii R24]
MIFNEVDDVSKLSGVHAPGKVVRVKAKGADPYYMVATGDQSGNTTGSWQTVTWKEAAAQVVTPGQCLRTARRSTSHRHRRASHP